MANLTLAHTGNMDIDDAYISNDRLYTSFGKNDTGAVTGFSFNPSQGSEFICGATYTINAYPRFSGTVLTETFVVSGTDTLGVRKSDSSVLMQNYDTDLTHYDIAIGSVGGTVISSSVTSDVVSVEFQIDDDEYAELDIQPGSGQVFTYPIDNIKVLPGPVVTATSINLIVDSAITNTGVAYVEYDPTGATVDIAYSISDTDIATIDSNGNITVLQNGVVTVCAIDIISGLRDCKQVTMTYYVEPVTGGTITSLSIVVPNSITGYGYASSSYEPSTAEVDLHYYSNLPEVASINETTGDIIVHSDGNVTFCVEDTVSGLRDCKNVSVIKTVYINSIEIVVGGTVMVAATASTNYSPSSANTFNFVYSSSDPSIATIDPDTGEIDVLSQGQVTFCVRDTYTNLSSCKTVNVKARPKVCVTYNIASAGYSQILSIYRNVTGEWLEDFCYKIEYNGESIDFSTLQQYTIPYTGCFGVDYNFPAPGLYTFCYDFKNYTIPRNSFSDKPVIAATIEEGIKYIRQYAFANTQIQDIVIPSSFCASNFNADNSYDNAFKDCKSLTGLTVCGITKSEAEIQYPFRFSNCGRMMSGCTNIERLVLGDGVYCDSVFLGMFRSKLRYVSFGNGFGAIEDLFFSNCTRLEEIILPNTLQIIGEAAFQYCTSLTSITIPEQVTKIENNCFYNAGLTSIEIPKNVKEIYHSVFSHCSSLESVVVHCDSVNLFGDYVWAYCSELKNITFKCDTQKDRGFLMGRHMFSDCEKLKSIVTELTNPSAITIYRETFRDIGTNGTLVYPAGSDYSSWLQNTFAYLGYYGWTGSTSL